MNVKKRKIPHRTATRCPFAPGYGIHFDGAAGSGDGESKAPAGIVPLERDDVVAHGRRRGRLGQRFRFELALDEEVHAEVPSVEKSANARHAPPVGKRRFVRHVPESSISGADAGTR
jgi:hypothetical protein